MRRIGIIVSLCLLSVALTAQVLVKPFNRDSMQRVKNPITRDWDIVRMSTDVSDMKPTTKFSESKFNKVFNPITRQYDLVRRTTIDEGTFTVDYDASAMEYVLNPWGSFDLIRKYTPSGGDEPLILEWDNIANVPVADAESVSDWNTFFGLPTNGTPFTSVTVVGNKVYLYGGSGITLKAGLFSSVELTSLSIISIVDEAGCVDSLECLIDAENETYIYTPFYYYTYNPETEDEVERRCLNLVTADLTVTNAGVHCFTGCAKLTSTGSITSAGDHCFQSCTSLASTGSIITAGDWCFSGCTSLATIDLSECTALGTDCTDNSVFRNITGNTITVTCAEALLTCNAGAPDGDLCYLAANNTITVNGAPLAGCGE